MWFHTKSSVEPSAPCWKYDLPGPNDPITITAGQRIFCSAPNHLDSVYMELPRSTIRTRGVGVLLTIVTVPLCLTMPMVWVLFSMADNYSLSAIEVAFDLLIFGISVWMAIYIWRMDREPPCDEPIRFNRARRKIYVYRFRHSGLRLFSKAAWGVNPEVYDWDCLHAEFCSTYGAMGTGGLIEAVSVAVLKPDTATVFDRFILAHGGIEAEMYWAMAQLFMQQGKQALPKFDRPPRDWNNEQHTFNLARRFAPKVVWPEAMDIESRTAPCCA